MADKAKSGKRKDERPARVRYRANDQRNKNKNRRVIRDAKRAGVELTQVQAQKIRDTDREREASRTPTEYERLQQRQQRIAKHPGVLRSAR